MTGNVISTAGCSIIALTKTSLNKCEAIYDGKLHIPSVKVKSPFGEEFKYEVDMMQYQPLSEPMSFQLTCGAKHK